MKLISHRGNLNGPNPKYENQPSYISKALKAGYEVEIDVWYTTMFWLGHDRPIYEVDPKFLQNSKLWCHAKNIEAVHMMKEFGNIHYFWHQEDDITLTSQNTLWAYPGKQPIKDSIAVMPEIYNDDISLCKGICSDYIKQYK